jgi:hypothetical protein
MVHVLSYFSIFYFNAFSAQEFTELQSQQNDDLTKCCENFFETLDGFAETKNKHRSATWPLQMMLLVILKFSNSCSFIHFAETGLHGPIHFI